MWFTVVCFSHSTSCYIVQDVDCSECYCRWCGRCSDLLSCKSCKRLFCSVCIRRNLGEEILTGIKTSGWQCCCCSPSILLPLVSVLEKIMESQGLVDSNTDTDSDNSDADINEHKRYTMYLIIMSMCIPTSLSCISLEFALILCIFAWLRKSIKLIQHVCPIELLLVY